MDDSNSPLNSNVPLSKVMELRSQGMPNNQIIQVLQNEGFSSDQIFDAMNQADMTQNIGQGMADPMSSPQQIENPMQMQPNPFFSSGRNTLEETTEAVVQEKWSAFANKINKIEEWKNHFEARLSKLESNFSALGQNFDKLHTALIGKIGEYDQNIINVGTEIKAMEKVFQKILPTFTENVNELSRITHKIKRD
jgi:DNA-binding transcriptional MerR regulator